MAAISFQTVPVDEDVTGLDISVANLSELARLIAIITLGQSEHAARIIQKLEADRPALSDPTLFNGAKGQLRIRGDSDEKRKVSRYHRDGFLFECISWITARQSASDRTFLKDPHITSTSQGLDGLMIEMDPTKPILMLSTIFEDKCTDSPRNKFHQQVLPTFSDHHESKRNRELVANAVTLIKESGLNGTEATIAAARVLDKNFRTYRATLTVTASLDSAEKRKALFKGYNGLAGITKDQRIGATFAVPQDLRTWFQTLAELAIQELDNFEALRNV